MEVRIDRFIEGARRAEGITVIIDVFRAFSLECWMYSFGARLIRPIGTVEEVFALREHFPDSVLVGERKGRKLDGFDFGNSPSTLPPEAVRGKLVLHTTSAGTQGIIAAEKAAEILTGSLVNAAAVAQYIKEKNPEIVTLVAMGTGGVVPAEEDELCAEYLRSLLIGEPMEDIRERAEALRATAGAKFFDPANWDVFPRGDFAASTDVDRFPFVLRIGKDAFGYYSECLLRKGRKGDEE